MTQRPAYVRFYKVHQFGSSRVEFADMEIGVKEYLTYIRTAEIVVEVIIQFYQLAYLQLVFRIQGMQFFVQRL